MKNDLWYLIFEDSDDLEFEIQDIEGINEANSIAETSTADIAGADATLMKKKYKIKGIFSTVNKRNKNGRIYPKDIMEAAVNDYVNNHLSNNTVQTLSEWQHPPRTNVDPMEAVAKITKLYWKDNYLMGEAVLLNNPKANQLKSLIDVGIKLGVSTRGLGKLDESKTVTQYKLITIDIVDNPSNYESYVSGLTESRIKDGIDTEKAYINENGVFKTVCLKDKCVTLSEADAKKLENNIIDKFKELINNNV